MLLQMYHTHPALQDTKTGSYRSIKDHGYTIEAGYGINPLPISQFDEIYNENEGILVLGARLS